MLFSIIIPTYNRGELIYPTLDSVLGQSETDFELIVVDDGSTDSTAEALEKYARQVRDKRIKIICQKNGGTTAARNTGIAIARGEYTALLDHDDLWLPWTLQTYREVIDQFNRLAFCVGSVVKQDADFSDLGFIEKEPLKTKYYKNFFCSSLSDISYYPSSWAIRTELLKSHGGFFPYNSGFEDIDLLLRLGDAATFIRIVKPVMAVRGIHEANLSSDRYVLWFAGGMDVLLERERTGQYPGGSAYTLRRRKMISSSVRSLSLGCIRAGKINAAWKLYRKSFVWHIQMGQLKYLVGLPLLLLASGLRPRKTSKRV